MKSSSMDRRIFFSTSPALALLLAFGCTGSEINPSSTGGSTSSGATGGSPAPGGSSNVGGSASVGGATSSGGRSQNGGDSDTRVSSAGGTTSSGGTTGAGGTTAKGGTAGTTATGSGGAPARDAGPATDGASGSPIDAGPSSVNCSAPMPTGGKTYTGSSVYGTADGLGYGIWTNGSGGSITVFTDAHAFSASWNNSQDFLAHLGLDFRPAKAWDSYASIVAEFSEIKSGTAGGFSMIGMYGWTNSPCIEWYINEDSWNGLGGGGNVTATIDGGTYYLKSVQTTGTGGANACESGHSGPWTQLISTRKGARTCGVITVSDHFAAWEKQGWKMGVLTSVHINVEVGGGNGKIDFPVANVVATPK
jgi:endo-1,4-beta-xylanase